jgi:hypothetical protein
VCPLGVDEDPGRGRGRFKIDSTDPRALRTRQKLVDAFHAAVAEADPAAMSVASLTRAAATATGLHPPPASDG